MSASQALPAARQREIRSTYRKLGSISGTARKCGCHPTIVRKYAVDCKDPVKPLVDGSKGGRGCAKSADPIADAKDRAKAAAAQKQYVEAIQEHAFRSVLTKAIKDAVQPIPPQPRYKAPRYKTAHNRSPLLCLTDWHFEEIVRPDGVLNLNEYSIQTSCRRIWRVVQAVREWKRDAEAGGRVTMKKLNVALMGDFLTGTLHGLEKHSDAPNVVRAALWCGDLIALVLKDLAQDFEEIEVVGVTGNHGRLPDSKKVPTKDPTRSWDYVAYEVARRRLDAHKQISWHLPDAYGVLFQVGGHWCYVAHGNFIPNNLGVVGYGVRRFTSSLASNLQAAGKPLRYAFFGHWHSANSSEFSGVEAFICPSLIGTQEYSFLSGGSVNKPAQHLFLFDEALGLVGMDRFYGEGPGMGGTYVLPPDATERAAA